MDIERYEVTRGDQVIGYVDIAGAVFVVLSGRRYDRSVEIAQTRDFERAIAALTATAATPNRSR